MIEPIEHHGYGKNGCNGDWRSLFPAISGADP
jgi:hypothetical protein